MRVDDSHASSNTGHMHPDHRAEFQLCGRWTAGSSGPTTKGVIRLEGFCTHMESRCNLYGEWLGLNSYDCEWKMIPSQANGPEEEGQCGRKDRSS